MLDLHKNHTRIVSSHFILSSLNDEDFFDTEDSQILATVSQVIEPGDILSFQEVTNLGNDENPPNGTYVQFVVNGSSFGR